MSGLKRRRREAGPQRGVDEAELEVRLRGEQMQDGAQP